MNDISITDQLAFVAQQAQCEFRTLLMWVCLSALAAMAVALLLYASRNTLCKLCKLIRWLGPVGCAMVLPGIVALFVYGSTKPVQHLWKFTFSNGIADNGSSATNNVATAKWTISNQLLLDGYVLKANYRNLAVTNASGVCTDNWHALEDGVVSALTKSWTVPDATNCEYQCWAQYVAPVVVHTNGVYHLGGVSREMGGTQKYVTPGVQIIVNLETGASEVITPTNQPPEASMLYNIQQED